MSTYRSSDKRTLKPTHAIECTASAADLPLLVALLEPGVEVRIVAGRDQRAGKVRPPVETARFPKTTVQFGEPLTFPVEDAPNRERQLEVAGAVFSRVREMYEGLAGTPEIPAS